jgi:tRNA G18 (ribose-2'-O)-methylase SpoU
MDHVHYYQEYRSSYKTTNEQQPTTNDTTTAENPQILPQILPQYYHRFDHRLDLNTTILLRFLPHKNHFEMKMTAQAFCSGAVASASLLLLIHYYYTVFNQQKKKKKATNQSRSIMDRSLTKTEWKTAMEPLMDSPLLDQRMIRKAEGAILKRTSRITIVVERCTNDHNYSAILRTAEALGVQQVWIISPPPTLDEDYNDNDNDDDNNDYETRGNILHRSKTGQIVQSTETERKERHMHHLFARKATEWLTVREFKTTSECILELRNTHHTIWATDLSQQAVCLTKEALPTPIPDKLAICFGTEAVGCTEELLHASDLRVYLPLRGFADSLNLSVAAALVLHQLFTLDPTLEGAMSESERTQLRELWFTKLASQRLLTQAQKKQRAKLEATIATCRSFQARVDAGEILQVEQRTKLAHCKYDEMELAAMELDIATKAQQAVKDLIENPPLPITDMRRADEHRTCYVGKNTKTKYNGIWDGMAATTNYQTPKGTSASFFRHRAGIDFVMDPPENAVKETVTNTNESIE